MGGSLWIHVLGTSCVAAVPLCRMGLPELTPSSQSHTWCSPYPVSPTESQNMEILRVSQAGSLEAEEGAIRSRPSGVSRGALPGAWVGASESAQPASGGGVGGDLRWRCIWAL